MDNRGSGSGQGVLLLGFLQVMLLVVACTTDPAGTLEGTTAGPVESPASPAAAVSLVRGGTMAWDEIEQQTVELSFIALAGFWHQEAAAVAQAVMALERRLLPEHEIVWGPAVHLPEETAVPLAPRVSDALVFVCRDKRTGDFFVVFRGTNPVSATEWLLQDFRVNYQVPWNTVQAGPAPAEALVSEGTATAVRLRSTLEPGAGLPGAGTTLGQALRQILEQAGGPVTLHFTGHSLGGLLAPVMALWLADGLEQEGRQDLLVRYRPVIHAYAGPTPGNRAFAAWMERRLGPGRRYANRLDVAPGVWARRDMAGLPWLYLPQTPMQSLTRSLYDYCLGLVRDREYAQPWPAINVPSRVVPTRGNLYLLQAAWQHVVPYLDMLEPDLRDLLLAEVLGPLTEFELLPGLKPLDVRDLYRAVE